MRSATSRGHGPWWISWTRPRGSRPTPWVLAVGARSAALLAAAEGDFDAAATGFDRAMRAHDDLPMPFERGRTLLAKGRLHRRRKEKRLADETLREALACFERARRGGLVRKAREELDASAAGPTRRKA